MVKRLASTHQKQVKIVSILSLIGNSRSQKVVFETLGLFDNKSLLATDLSGTVGVASRLFICGNPPSDVIIDKEISGAFLHRSCLLLSTFA